MPAPSAPTAARPLRREPLLFDVCHAGVVLRTVVFVHACLALSMAWHASAWRDWLTEVSLAVVFVLPATLAWLLLVCRAQRLPVARSRPAYWCMALVLGGVVAMAARLGWQRIGAGWPLDDGLTWPVSRDSPAWTWGTAALSGAALAGCVVHWLEQRRQLQGPVATAARLAELQARIRPHFLFNALNSAVALVRLDPPAAESVLEDLSELFRAALAETEAAVTLGQELALAERYLAIEQVRFGARMTVRWDLDPVAGTARLPPLVLQPLVENAVRHGIETLPDGGDILISTHVRRGRVVIEIVNARSPAAVMAGSSGGNGMALGNVRDRLYLMHDVALRFQAGPTPDGRWAVRIEVPLQDTGGWDGALRQGGSRGG